VRRVWVTAAFIVLGAVGIFAAAHAQNPGLSGQPVYNQGTQFRAVTPSDTASLPQFTRAIYIGDGVACNIAVVGSGDTAAITFTNMPPGWQPMSVKKVMSTNTSCVTIIAGF
jgi:hypothetical protein